MELNIEAFLDGEWDALRNMFSHEDADFMLQTNADRDFFTNNDYDGGLILQTNSIFWPPVNDEGNNNQNVGIWDANSQCLNNLDDLYNFNNNVSQESSNTSNASEFDPFCKDNFLNNLEDVLGGCLMQEQNSNFLDLGNNYVHCQPLNIIAHSDDEHLMKRKFCDTPKLPFMQNSMKNPSVFHSRILPRNLGFQEMHQKRKTNVQPNPKLSMTKAKNLNNMDENEINNIALKNLGHGPNNSCTSSEDDYCKVSKESNGGETSSNKGSDLNLKGKKRSTRSSATDPQSLYARKRRERINERLRILQNLIPNGTKVDISTMLEEAVHYVKFMQLQIKLLSSDDMWMYAPIVYNGMDMGLLGKHLLM